MVRGLAHVPFFISPEVSCNNTFHLLLILFLSVRAADTSLKMSIAPTFISMLITALLFATGGNRGLVKTSDVMDFRVGCRAGLRLEC